MKALLSLWLLVFSAPVFAADCEPVKAALREGDLLFIEVDHLPFTQVAETTRSWTSHVGIAFRERGRWVVYESALPTSHVTELCKFLDKSTHGRVAVTRSHDGVTPEQVETMRAKAKSLLGIFYHTGFDFDDGKQFCSKYAYLVYRSIGVTVGQIITFRDLLNLNPPGPERERLEKFWTSWFHAGFRFSGIPWDRRTITPASQLNDPSFDLVLGQREI